jgi:DNA-binding CsgD family transcriptional regulator
LTNRSAGKVTSGLDVLTDREFEVFHLLGQGLTTRQISQRLCLSIPTIGTHKMHIKHKLKLQSGAQLIQTAARWVAAETSAE